MNDLTLTHPVHTLERQMLLPAGTVLSGEALNDFLSLSAPPVLKTYSLLQHGSVRKDILEFLSVPPYVVIYPDREHVDELLRLMDSIELGVPVLESLDYFKEHDFHTYRHILMVFSLSSILADDLVPGRDDRLRLAATGPTHDIGKICVPIHLLKKTTPLTRSERAVVNHHSAAGHVLLTYYLRDPHCLASTVARDHHERNDGSGLPRGILLRNPMVEIIAACDVYDALISPRPYRPVSYDNRTALEEIIRMAEQNKIGWDVVKALVARNRRSKTHYSQSEVSTEKRGTPPPGNVYGVTAEEEDGSPVD